MTGHEQAERTRCWIKIWLWRGDLPDTEPSPNMSTGDGGYVFPNWPKPTLQQNQHWDMSIISYGDTGTQKLQGTAAADSVLMHDSWLGNDIEMPASCSTNKKWYLDISMLP